MTSEYLGLRVKSTKVKYFTESCDFVNGVATKNAATLLGFTPTYVGAVCQPVSIGGAVNGVGMKFDGTSIKITLFGANASYTGSMWITATLFGTE